MQYREISEVDLYIRGAIEGYRLEDRYDMLTLFVTIQESIRTLDEIGDIVAFIEGVKNSTQSEEMVADIVLLLGFIGCETKKNDNPPMDVAKNLEDLFKNTPQNIPSHQYPMYTPHCPHHRIIGDHPRLPPTITCDGGTSTVTFGDLGDKGSE